MRLKLISKEEGNYRLAPSSFTCSVAYVAAKECIEVVVVRCSVLPQQLL